MAANSATSKMSCFLRARKEGSASPPRLYPPGSLRAAGRGRGACPPTATPERGTPLKSCRRHPAGRCPHRGQCRSNCGSGVERTPRTHTYFECFSRRPLFSFLHAQHYHHALSCSLSGLRTTLHLVAALDRRSTSTLAPSLPSHTHIFAPVSNSGYRRV